jgi:hypothetical protein
LDEKQPLTMQLARLKDEFPDFTSEMSRDLARGRNMGAPSRPRVDNTLLRAVVQAFHWNSQLASGQFATVSELAKSEGLNGSLRRARPAADTPSP